MYNKKIKTFISLLLAVFLLASLSLVAFADGEEKTKEDEKAKVTKAQTVMEEYFNPNGRILSVAKQGDVSSFPENSWQGINSAIKKGADIVEIDINITSDGFLVLMKDEDFSRMCVDPEGNTITSKVSETESWEVIAMCLRQGRGGEANEPTDYHPQTLEAVVKAVGDKAVLLLNFDSEIRDKVYEEIASLDALNRVIFRMDSKAGAVKKFISSHENENIAVLGGYRGNVVFSARGYVKKMKKASAAAVMLGVKNPNGVIFDKSVMGLFTDGVRAAVDMTDPKSCGEREDNENGWNDLLSRGYSIIETDYPDKLSDYITQFEKEKAALNDLVEKAKSLDMTKYGYKTAKTLEKELEKSEKLLSVHTSKQALNAEYSVLNTAILNLDASDGSTNGRTVTAGRIIAVVFVVVLFVLSQLVIIKHSKKEK